MSTEIRFPGSKFASGKSKDVPNIRKMHNAKCIDIFYELCVGVHKK